MRGCRTSGYLIGRYFGDTGLLGIASGSSGREAHRIRPGACRRGGQQQRVGAGSRGACAGLSGRGDAPAAASGLWARCIPRAVRSAVRFRRLGRADHRSGADAQGGDRRADSAHADVHYAVSVRVRAAAASTAVTRG